jgi:hypothetical protein
MNTTPTMHTHIVPTCRAMHLESHALVAKLSACDSFICGFENSPLRKNHLILIELASLLQEFFISALFYW